MKLRPLLEGAPNFRQVDGLPVYGVAIPTVRGLRSVLEELGAGTDRRKVLWHNMREEPVIYINGRPYVVREADQPFCNLEYTGIDKSRVEDMEARLKQDVLKEAGKYGKNILVAHENDDMQVIEVWEPVTESDVQTPLEVYAELIADGYDVDYLRVPVTDEQAPKDNDFELLIGRLWNVPEGAALIFNCQMGRGRTTTGMIIASLLYLRRMGGYPTPQSNGHDQAAGKLPAWFKPPNGSSGVAPPGDKDMLKAGYYGVIRSLLRVLDRGAESKAVLDLTIDAASAMQNLREAISVYRGRVLAENRENKRAAMSAVTLEYLERYYMLVAFSAYLHSPSFSPDKKSHVPFPVWTASRPELRGILDRMLRRNTMSALELHQQATLMDGARAPTPEEEQDHLAEAAAAAADKLIAQRAGAVLGPNTILKQDHFPGMRSKRTSQLLEGAPNFRGVTSFPVYGVGMCSVDGMRAILREVTSRPSGGAARGRTLWFNMREEPVLYINGQPYVLREQIRPLKNLQEYAGIDTTVLEGMEQRLKADVLAEAAKFDGRLLVMREDVEAGGQLRDAWEGVGDQHAVQTPREVYAMLQAEGFHVSYVRVPVTDGKAPTASDIDTIRSHIVGAGLHTPVVFNCQVGSGRTTTGMVVACLLHLYNQPDLDRTGSALMSIEQLDLLTLQGELHGHSPRSEEEDHEEDHEEVRRPWDMSGEEAEELRSLASGGYMGVRRLTRLLENGEAAKRLADSMIDACSQLINLRVAIMRYRKPRHSYKYIRSDVQGRHTAFARGSSYLERYCGLVAFSSFMQAEGADDDTLSYVTWLGSRPEVECALQMINANPAAALAPVPVSAMQVLYKVSQDGSGEVTLHEQAHVLSRRRGRTLSKRTILKSYQYYNTTATPGSMAPGLFTPGGGRPGSMSAPLPDFRVADEGLPVYTVGNTTVEQLRRLLSHLGAGPMGRHHVVVSDVREELVVYIHGTPYVRRELEMPAAALHHAGIHWKQLEELEALLAQDVRKEASKWGGRVLLHREVPPEGAPPVTPPGSAANGVAHAPAGAAGHANGFAGTPPPPLLTLPGMTPSYGNAAAQADDQTEDVTKVVDRNPGETVAPFWEDVPGGAAGASVVQTPRNVYEALRAEGYAVSYRRIPLSRERTPVASDLQDLYLQMRAAATRPERSALHLVLSRTATGSSGRFTAAALCCYLLRPEAESPRADSQGGVKRMRRSGSDLGEYRGIMSVARLLRNGWEMKQAVDTAIDCCSKIGNLRLDIKHCKRTMEAAPAPTMEQPLNERWAARQLGIHYLKRYFLLIAFRTFLEHPDAPGQSFADWEAARPELHHLVSQLDLDTIS